MRFPALLRAGIASLALAAPAIPAAPAAADSIAYVKEGNVWLAAPDGTRQVQVTRTGGYASVSQADDGTMIALAPRERLHRLSRTGEVLADFPTYVSDGAPTSGPVNEFHGPFAPEISPDGKLVAFEWFNESYENGHNCTTSEHPALPGAHLAPGRRHHALGRLHRIRGVRPDDGLDLAVLDLERARSCAPAPARSSTRTRSSRTSAPDKADSELKRWFWDERGIGVDDVEISRDGRAVVGIAGFGDEFLRVYRPLFDPATAPAQDLRPFAQNTPVVAQCFEFTGPAGGRFETPTFAPDGHGLAWAAGDGVHVTTVPDLAGGCAPAQAERLVLPGARSPDWGPAEVPAATQVISAGDGAPRARPAQVKVVAARTRLSAALRRGLPVTVHGPAGSRVSVTAVVRRRVAGSGAARVGGGGTAKVRVRFTARARRSLAAAGSLRVTLKVVVKAGGAADVRRTAALTLR